MSDVSIRVEERNKVAMSVLEGVLADAKEGTPAKVAMLYGVYHLQDLTRRLKELGFELEPLQQSQSEEDEKEEEEKDKDKDKEQKKSLPALPKGNLLTAWRIEMPPTLALAPSLSPSPAAAASSSSSSSGQDMATLYVPILITASLYLLVSTFDWLVRPL